MTRSLGWLLFIVWISVCIAPVLLVAFSTKDTELRPSELEFCE